MGNSYAQMDRYNRAMSALAIQSAYGELSDVAEHYYKTSNGHINFMIGVQDYLIALCGDKPKPHMKDKIYKRAYVHQCAVEFNWLVHLFTIKLKLMRWDCEGTPDGMTNREKALMEWSK